MSVQVKPPLSLETFKGQCVVFVDGGRKSYGIVVKGQLFRLPGFDGRVPIEWKLDNGFSLTLVRQGNWRVFHSTIHVSPSADPMIMAAISAMSNGDAQTPFQVQCLLHVNTR